MKWIVKGDKYDVFIFWAAYVMTRPVGASTGDLLGNPVAKGGWGFGVGYTSLLFFGIIVIITIGVSYTKVDVDPNLIAITPNDARIAPNDNKLDVENPDEKGAIQVVDSPTN